MKKKYIILVILVVLFICWLGGIKLYKHFSIDTNGKITLSCNKEENCCKKDSDCSYIRYAWGCNTDEYVDKKNKENEARWTNISAAPYQDPSKKTCKCILNTCITR